MSVFCVLRGRLHRAFAFQKFSVTVVRSSGG
nr:MAG TPA: hypothetical protein [Caudoviricetes sp.]